ncbi:MAG: thymidine phosphorylase [Candidatus Heimdallarchaeota archaeon]|nr:thymidine phosphorylase [Candidatus Heimdallarchaeota archaeon]
MKFKITPHLVDGIPSNYILVHPSKSEKHELKAGTLLVSENNTFALRLLISSSIPEGLAGMAPDKMNEFNIKDGEEIELVPSGVEGVTRIIRRKMDKRTLTSTEIESFISALNMGMLTNSHIAAFGTAVQINGMHEKETTAVAQAIYNHSKRFKAPSGKIVVDKHSIGGVAGNRITPLMIPIIAASGLVIPKVSTRAITSPSGTVDTLEVVMNADLTFEEAEEVINKTNGCMVNGETVGLGSVADKFLSAVKQVKIDPKQMMIASILAKKKAAGAEYVIIDLPTGKGSKLPTRTDARRLAYDFSSVGSKLGMTVEAVISPGDKPIGDMIGPALEMTEVLKSLEGDRSSLSLNRKALNIAGLIFESVGRANRGEGHRLAAEILNSGKALQKFREIVEAQGGDPNVTSDSIPVAPYNHIITADQDDIVYTLDSYNIGMIARAAGAPSDKMAGVILHADRGEQLHKGDPIIEIRAHSEGKLTDAIQLMKTSPPITLERTILEHITGASNSEEF